MLTKTFAVDRAASIKRTLDRLETAQAALPDSAEKAAVLEQTARLHAKLNRTAKDLAEIFGDTAETFSGGTGKP